MMIKQLDTRCRLLNRNIIVRHGKLIGFGNDNYWVGQSIEDGITTR